MLPEKSLISLSRCGKGHDALTVALLTSLKSRSIQNHTLEPGFGTIHGSVCHSAVSISIKNPISFSLFTYAISNILLLPVYPLAFTRTGRFPS